jgi:hypothetical protein
MLKLYEIAEAIRARLESVDESGEIPAGALKALGELECDFETKIDGVCGLIAEWKVEVAARQAEIDRLRRGLEARKNNIEKLKKYVHSVMYALRQKRVETSLWTLWVQRNSQYTVEFTGSDPGDLPPELQRVTFEPNKVAALQQFEATGKCPEQFTIKLGHHLRIK